MLTNDIVSFEQPGPGGIFSSPELAQGELWDTAMSVVHVDARDVQDVRDVRPSTFLLVHTLEGTVLIQSS